MPYRLLAVCVLILFTVLIGALSLWPEPNKSGLVACAMLGACSLIAVILAVWERRRCSRD